MLRLAPKAAAMEERAPPLARLLRIFLRSRRAMVEVANAARSNDVSAANLLSIVEDGDVPGLRLMRRAWADAVPETTPPDWWCEYMAWTIDKATEGQSTPTAAAVRSYFVAVRDAGQALKVAYEAAHADLYATPTPDGEGGAISPTLTAAQSAGIVAAIDNLVAAIEAQE